MLTLSPQSTININSFTSDENKHHEGGVTKTGGEEFNSPDHSGGGRPHGQGHGTIPDIDDDHVVNTAAAHGSGESDLFSKGLAFVKTQLGGNNHDIDEERLIKHHDEVYNKGNTSLDASSLGSAAALQAFKQFVSSDDHSSSSGHKSGGGGGGGSGSTQSKLVGLAMAEASKLFEKSGGAASGGKQDAVNGAATTVLKLLIKSKFSHAIGGSNSGGLGQLAGLAGKFL
ncbi:uncharacterized protein EI90DRAFT_3144414 [Cantharellus anzutake]|uniref:uncharacterized protein n=1 Tax=Cantharellus anzutake TaxID=1750568 RepID=UPI0019062597|nr:uncharacterized protein EI90DRAFT_3144414 [Cantharellus anzutake]KAF8338248.1 hypothetical protein EI90DRAFT_3144414 [Cantharellus anzutake]